MSERLYRLAAIVKADVLIRLRRPSTAIVFLLIAVIPYMWIPDPKTGRALIQIAGMRALYNSAAIGMATAVLGTIFIGLVGFYVIANALRRDVVSRCGFVIASTTMRGSEYILGKFAGNVAFLTLFTLGYMTTAMAMVLVRGEAPLEPFVFAKQYLILMPPSIAFVSALAVLFECTPLLRTKLGDVLYFFLWVSLMGSVTMLVEKGVAASWAPYFDISGLGFLLHEIKTTYHTNALSIGSTTFDATKPVVVFRGLQMTFASLAPRIGATLWPLALLAIARLFFHRFDPARVRVVPNEKSHRSWLGRLNFVAKPFARLLVRAGEVTLLLPAPALVRAALTDALATIAAFPLAALAIGGFAIASFFANVLPVAFAACAIVLADIACREKRAATTALVYAIPELRARFVAWKFLTALFVAMVFLGVPLARAILVRPASSLSLLAGLLFTVAASTTLGIVSANPKTFLVGFLTLWYIALSDNGRSPALDFAGWFGTATPAIAAAYAAIAATILIGAQLFHTHELRRRW